MNLSKALLPWMPLDRIASRRWLGIAAVALMLPAILCGCTRSVDWKEEVPLNTGETIWVYRSGSYSFDSASGNPLEFGYQPNRETTIDFEYRGRSYSYQTDATLQLLAISPDGTPNLIVSATDYMWQWKHDYRCVRPSYVQLRPDPSGKTWNWPSEIEPWLYGMPTNLLIGMPEANTGRVTITAADRSRRNSFVFVAGKQYQSIDPTFEDRRCKRRS